MVERYDTDAAAHYAAYRPPLHEQILEKALGRGRQFDVGIDFGCGTGRSTLALARHCDRVVGVDPSPAMLQQADPHERVSYLVGAGDAIPLPDKSADIITFAGSLHYADSEKTRMEVLRVGQPNATVLVYDFDLKIDPVLTRLGIDSAEAIPPESDYDHTANLSGRAGFVERQVTLETTDTEVSASDFAHIVLSDSNQLDRLARQYGSGSVHASLVEALRANADVVAIKADLHFSTYTLAE